MNVVIPFTIVRQGDAEVYTYIYIYRPVADDVTRCACDVVRHVGVPLKKKYSTANMVICTIVGCCNTSKQAQGISFYRLPAVILHKGERAKELSQK